MSSAPITVSLPDGSSRTLTTGATAGVEVDRRETPLGKLAGSDYRTALTERVLMPLGMRNTSTESSDEQAAQLATAHMKKNKPTKHWDFTEVTVGAGGVRSPLSDMFKFLRANIDTKNSKLADALKLMREPSTLPECDSKPGSFTRSMYVLPFVWLTLLLGIFAGLFGALHWLSGIAVGYQLIPIMVLTFVAAILRGMTAGTLTLAVLTFLTWWYWKDGYDWIMNLLLGPSLIYMGSAWKDEFAKRGGGEGRLAWHSSEVGGHQMLWHNGMVGGSASFLSIVPELEIGVIVLTNTANSVDAIGVKIMSELVKLKEEQPSA